MAHIVLPPLSEIGTIDVFFNEQMAKVIVVNL